MASSEKQTTTCITRVLMLIKHIDNIWKWKRKEERNGKEQECKGALRFLAGKSALRTSWSPNSMILRHLLAWFTINVTKILQASQNKQIRLYTLGLLPSHSSHCKPGFYYLDGAGPNDSHQSFGVCHFQVRYL